MYFIDVLSISLFLLVTIPLYLYLGKEEKHTTNLEKMLQKWHDFSKKIKNRFFGV